MIKLASVVFIALGFAASGFYFSSVYIKKTELLNEMVMMLGTVKTQLRYTHLPVSSILISLRENKNISGLGFVSSCSEKIRCGEPFPDLWRKSIENEKELCRLVPEAAEHLIRFGETLGTTDLEGQLSCCEYYESIFLKELNEKEEQSKKYEKLFPAIGIMLGISAAIMIV